MELFLNILWLALALGAFGLWSLGILLTRRRHCGPLPQLALLTCVLVLLFPVISATDDLHPIRTELEESTPSKRIKKTTIDKSSGDRSVFDTYAIQLTRSFLFPFLTETRGLVSSVLDLPAQQALLGEHPLRAPPNSILG